MALYKVVIPAVTIHKWTIQGRTLEVDADSEREAKKKAIQRRVCDQFGNLDGGAPESEYERLEHDRFLAKHYEDDLWLTTTEVTRITVGGRTPDIAEPNEISTGQERLSQSTRK